MHVLFSAIAALIAMFVLPEVTTLMMSGTNPSREEFTIMHQMYYYIAYGYCPIALGLKFGLLIKGMDKNG